VSQPEIVSPFARTLPVSWPRYWWVNVTCVIATLISTTVFGSALVISFRLRQSLDLDQVWHGYVRLLHGDPAVWLGLEFSVPLLLILLAHELGHYLQCRHWRVDATLPYFLPSPTLFGTFGAFIRIKSPILSRRSLFDIGIAGPLAGFAVLVPFLVVGVALSQSLPAAPEGAFAFSSPLAVLLLEKIFFPHTAPAKILLHPMAMAAWTGLLATAINLLPVGQLDGGHLVYATFGPRVHKVVSTVLVGILAVLGFWYWTWWAWALVLFFFGRRHPLVYDHALLPTSRLQLMLLAGIIFLLSFSIIPVRIG
jgi:membrane-associated protease RseP (regulator of RpoE activity)